jgi:hypothetical protein
MVLGSTSVFDTTWQDKNEESIIITFSCRQTKGAKCSKSTKWQTWWPDEPVVAAPHTRRDAAGAGWLKALMPPAVHVPGPCTGLPADWMFWYVQYFHSELLCVVWFDDRTKHFGHVGPCGFRYRYQACEFALYYTSMSKCSKRTFGQPSYYKSDDMFSLIEVILTLQSGELGLW